MKKKSLVKYIGGLDKLSKKVYKLKVNEIYTVKEVCQGNFNGEWKPAIKLEEIPDFAFSKSLFVEILKPINIDDLYSDVKVEIFKVVKFESITKNTKFNILDSKN